MTLKEKTIIRRHGKCRTMYLSIPSHMAQDSKFPFKDGGVVEVSIDVVAGILIVKKVSEL